MHQWAVLRLIPSAGCLGTDRSSPNVVAAAEFPPAQRPYVLFLAAVDSHRLNSAVTRFVHAASS